MGSQSMHSQFTLYISPCSRILCFKRSMRGFSIKIDYYKNMMQYKRKIRYQFKNFLYLNKFMIINRLKLWYCFMEQQGFKTRQQCLTCLDGLGIKYVLHEHQPVFNMEQLSKVKLEKSPYVKNLFYTDKKPNSYYMVIAETNTAVQKGFWKAIGTSHNNVRFAKQEQVESVLKAKKGSVNVFGLANDEKKQVKKLLIDEKLYNFESWAFHPMDNSATIQVLRTDALKFLDHFKIPYEKIDLTQQVKVEQKAKEQKKPKQEVNLMGIQSKKEQDFSNWYAEVINRSGMLDYYDISGCYILRPWAYGIWERIQTFFDGLIKEHGVQNAYFPMFVSKKALETQKQHVQGFAAQVAWVTKSGKSDLEQPIAIRPTSQTIMYPAYANWIRSHRDLPLRLNQWTNIVRWQFKHPTPFIRTRQFLWQEGHTAHATFDEAQQQTFTILDYYRRVYEEVLSVPVYKGVKTQSQKFAGGFKTTTIQTWIPQNGRAIQAATSHNLGQNFAKMFKIQFEDEKKEKKFVWQTSWGLTTRSIGILTMHHGDNKGLVLPPRVANIQVVIVPIIMKGKQQKVINASNQIFTKLKKSGVRTHIDDRDNYTPGWKYNHWQLKGVPIRMEIGPKDVDNKKVVVVFRYNGQRRDLTWEELNEKIPQYLDQIQKGMYLKAKEKFENRIKKADNWENFITCLNERNVVLTPWCQNRACEQKTKERSGIQSKQMATEGQTQLSGQAKTLCVPLDAEPLAQGAKCFHCEQPAKVRVFWGRSY